MSSPILPQILNPPSVAAPKPTYSHVAVTPLTSPATKLITIAGQIGTDAHGKVPASFAGQVENALANVEQCLAAAGASTRNIVKVTHYIVNYDPKDRTRGELYLKFMGEHRPPSTLIPVPALADEGLLYEIEVMAVVAE